LDGGNRPIEISQLEDISPPERATGHSGMGDIATVITIPNECNPRNVSLVVKLVKMFEKKGLVL